MCSCAVLTLPYCFHSFTNSKHIPLSLCLWLPLVRCLLWFWPRRGWERWNTSCYKPLVTVRTFNRFRNPSRSVLWRGLARALDICSTNSLHIRLHEDISEHPIKMLCTALPYDFSWQPICHVKGRFCVWKPQAMTHSMYINSYMQRLFFVTSRLTQWGDYATCFIKLTNAWIIVGDIFIVFWV